VSIFAIFAIPAGRRRSPRPTAACVGGLPVLIGLLALATAGAAVLPPARVARAAPGAAAQDMTLYAGPGTEYDPLGYAPTGAALSVDGEAVNGFYPVSYDGTSGWAATWAVAAAALPAEAAFVPEPVYEDGVYEDPAVEEVVFEEIVSEEAVVEETFEEVAAAPTEGGIVGIIYAAADAYGQSREDMLRVATCESGLDPNAVGGGLYHGLFQFVPSTFAGTPFGGQSIYDPAANANAAAWMWSQGRRGEWVCQ